MTAHPSTPEEEHAFYAAPENQRPQGPAQRRRKRLDAPIPVRFTEDQLETIKQRAAEDDRSVSAWIRRAVKHGLERTA